VVVAPSSSSTKKAAKLAKSGSGKKVRFQGGTLFPVIVTVVIMLGLTLVAYARQSQPSVDASGAPQESDHWTHSYGFYLCDTWVQLEGDAEQRGSDNYAAYARTGIHSDDDGLIHWHPFSSAAVGRNATLGVFLDTYDVDLTNDKLTFPETQQGALEAQLAGQDPPRESVLVWEDGDKCSVNGSDKDAELQVIVWNSFADTDDGTTYIADFDNIRLDRDEMVVAIAFVPDDTDVSKPPWTPQPPSLAETGTDVSSTIPDTDISSTIPETSPDTTEG
jgi:hypothetical protein